MKQPELLRIDDKVEIQQKKALKKLRASRDKKKLEKALSAMQSAAETDENLMPYIITLQKHLPLLVKLAIHSEKSLVNIVQRRYFR